MLGGERPNYKHKQFGVSQLEILTMSKRLLEISEISETSKEFLWHIRNVEHLDVFELFEFS